MQAQLMALYIMSLCKHGYVNVNIISKLNRERETVNESVSNENNLLFYFSFNFIQIYIYKFA